jgi:magnesium chelatase subunit D
VRVGENARRSKEVGDILIVLISDGKANVSLHHSLASPSEAIPQQVVLTEIRQEVLGIAAAIRGLGIELLVIDTSAGHRPSALAAELARQGGGCHQSLPAATRQEIAATTRQWLSQPSARSRPVV